MNFERGGYQPKGTPDSNCCEPPKGGSAMQEEIVKPMNPYATEDFKNAIAEATKRLNESLERIGKQMKVSPPLTKDDVPYVNFDDMPTEYSGIMRLNFDGGMLQYIDMLENLLMNGYEVTMRLEDATETEKELDGADKFVVIEYEEVE